MTSTIRNTLTVAWREFTWRGRTRVYVITTALLVVVAVAVAMIPIAIRYFEGTSSGDKLGVYIGNAAPQFDVIATTDAIVNQAARANAARENKPAKDDFVVQAVSDLDTGRSDVRAGTLKAVLALDRGASGDLQFTLYSDMKSFERTPQLLQYAAGQLATTDRLARAGIEAAKQQAIFAPPAFTFAASVTDGSKAGGSQLENLSDVGSTMGIGFALSIFIFMAIMLYGQWVAMSVAEEKSSRVMELILGAATPFQLMAGKVLGVGALALLQMLVVLIPAGIVVLFQNSIASLVLGGTASSDLPQGLTVQLLVGFGVLFILGFGLYATLYAGAASLVSRQEDVNQMVAPLTLLSTAGYLVAVYTSTGLISLGTGVFAFLSYIPFLTPYLMLGRIASGDVQPWEPVLAVAILAVSVVGALWIASRLYSAGVLMYGQKPGFRSLVHAIRTS